MEEFHPTSEEGVEEVVKWALATGTPLEIIGSGSKRSIGHAVKAGAALHMDRLSGILSYEPGELVLSAWAGTPMAEIEAALDAERQHLAFEPPDFSGTLGGTIASGFAGPRRLIAGSARDHVLGLTGVTGRGETFRIGGRVVKNVTGYDLSKLLTGSLGTLAVMTRVTIKILPRPAAVRTLHVSDPGRDEGLDLLRRAAASPFSVTGASLDASGCFMRIEGRDDEIDVRMKKLQVHLDIRSEVLGSEASIVLWRDMRDLTAWADRDIIWRITLPRARAAEVASRLEGDVGGDMIFDWAGARLWLGLSLKDAGSHTAIRKIAGSSGGKAMLFRAPDNLKADIPVFHPEPAALGALTARVRDAFDPQRILNPGRMGDF